MNDMRAVIIPRSDQINADDLLAGPLTITITKVTIKPGTEQPVAINFDGDNGKPYKPCKSMARVMVHCWGPDANEYIGRSMTLYCDPTVRWGGMEIGGIRISHISHIKGQQTMALTVTKGSKKPFTVKVLKDEPPPPTKPDPSEIQAQRRTAFLDKLEADLAAAKLSDEPGPAIDAILGHPDVKRAEDAFTNGFADRLYALIQSVRAPDFPGDAT
jgi:hypothetical protein